MAAHGRSECRGTGSASLPRPGVPAGPAASVLHAACCPKRREVAGVGDYSQAFRSCPRRLRGNSGRATRLLGASNALSVSRGSREHERRAADARFSLAGFPSCASLCTWPNASSSPISPPQISGSPSGGCWPPAAGCNSSSCSPRQVGVAATEGGGSARQSHWLRLTAEAPWVRCRPPSPPSRRQHRLAAANQAPDLPCGRRRSSTHSSSLFRLQTAQQPQHGDGDGGGGSCQRRRQRRWRAAD